ncbi:MULTISPECIES: sigma-70 family RNA polymerase sigma factor [Cetobacterium]|uniref:Sigma-70 family RNA polymerase sigma factor n=1 Tax=Candidatus Cetobacterium colombiensis TaxID=3073100 RepID=A0ABU4W7V7_9FUSO|nr:sigma-70 family RNA polymerase sigma factor [Candidatus Cetobacterium colombiensis]MDX8335270.1 sigma-70 family RNA polymerase sigma factor [Candidatus Cetobacterium colombiensis]
MKVREFEKEILKNCIEDKDFVNFLKNNKDLKLDVENVDIRKEEKVEENNYVVESIVGEYLEEISYIQPLSKEEIENILETLDEEESSHKLVEANLREVANIAFDYLVAGIDYLDLIQEGNIGIIKALEEYRPSNGDVLDYIKLWARREMVFFVDEKVETEKYMYKGYFSKRREELLEHEIVAELEDETEEEVSLEEKSEVIEEKMNEVEKLDYTSVYKKISHLEEEVLKRYYGLVGEKRESLFEIENALDLKRGEGEQIFEEALTKISLGGGRSLKI